MAGEPRRIEVYPVAAVLGSRAAEDGSAVRVLCKWTNGEQFMLQMPLPVATHLQIALQDASADAALQGGAAAIPVIAEALALQPSVVPGQEILTVRVEGGMQLQFQVPKDRYHDGIPRPPLP